MSRPFLVPGTGEFTQWMIEAEKLRRIAEIAQQLHWETLAKLEKHLGFELDGTQDLSLKTVEDLCADFEQQAADDEEDKDA